MIGGMAGVVEVPAVSLTLLLLVMMGLVGLVDRKGGEKFACRGVEKKLCGGSDVW